MYCHFFGRTVTLAALRSGKPARAALVHTCDHIRVLTIPPSRLAVVPPLPPPPRHSHLRLHNHAAARRISLAMVHTARFLFRVTLHAGLATQAPVRWLIMCGYVCAESLGGGRTSSRARCLVQIKSELGMLSTPTSTNRSN